jgi:hypothetical protein
MSRDILRMRQEPHVLRTNTWSFSENFNILLTLITGKGRAVAYTLTEFFIICYTFYITLLIFHILLFSILNSGFFSDNHGW